MQQSRVLVSLFAILVMAASSSSALAQAETVQTVVTPAAPPDAPAPQVPPATPTGPAPKARCDKPVHDFGEVWSGDKVEEKFEIANDGNAVLEIPEVKASCGCTATEFDKLIEPGKKGTVKAVVNTHRMRGRINKKVFVKTNDPGNEQISLTIEGNVKERLQMEPPNGANFNRVIAGDAVQPQKIKITNHTDNPIKIELANPDQQDAVFKAAIAEIEAGKVYEITITAEPPYAEGNNFSQLRIKTGLEAEPELQIPCRLYAPPALEIIPATIMLVGPLTRDTSRPVQIRYNGEDNLKVTGAQANDPQITARVDERKAGKEYVITITLPQGTAIPAEQPAQLTITTDHAKYPQIVVPIQMQMPQQPQKPRVIAQNLIGQRAPQVNVKNLAGGDVQVGGASDKVTVIDFWATWCRFCRRQIPAIQRIADDYAAKGVEFVMISTDKDAEASAVQEKAKAMEMKLPFLLDTKEKDAAEAYGASGLPMLFLVGKSGIIEAVHSGGGKDDQAMLDIEKQIRAELDVLLAGKSRADFPTPPLEVAASDLPAQTPQAGELPAQPLLAVESLRQETGAHKSGEEITHNLYYRNGGGEPLTISSVSGSDGASIEPGYATTVEPTKSGVFQVKFKAPEQPGDFTRMVTIKSNDPTRSPLVVTLTGTVKPYIEVTPATIDFSRNPRIHSMPRLATVAYNGEGTVNYLKVETDTSKFKARLEPIPNSPYQKLIIEANPPFDQGETRGVIRIHTDHAVQKIVEVPVTLMMPPRVEITPPEVVLSPSSRLQQNAVLISNNGEKPLHILEVTRGDESIRTQFYPETDGMSYRLRMTFPANFAPSDATTRITIRTDDPEYKEIVIPIRVVEAKAVSAAPTFPAVQNP